MMLMKSSHHTMFKKRIVFMVIIAWGCQLVAGPLWAAPQGGVVTSGTATINQSGHVTNINQATQRAAINWQSFSTRPQETVNFHQPNAAAIALNRVIGNERSILEGALNATGRVFLINSNGILFAKGSTVNTAGFIASTLNLSDEDFTAGNYAFTKNGPTGSVINMGTITAKEGGYVALLGPAVSNQGVIAATKGSVALASGDKVTLNFNGDSLVNVTVDQGTLNALVENKEAVYADGGKVILTAKAADDLLSSQVNNSGIIEAKTIDDLKGSITLYAHGGTAAIDGTLDASAPITGDGGFIETSGDRVKIADTAFITTKSAAGTNGTWLIDPTDFTIGDGGDITGTLISNFLKGTDITIQSAMGTKGTEGNINVNDAVSWSADTTLALDAANNVNVNAAITATGENAKLALDAGKDINVNKDITLSGTNAALTMNYGGDYHIFMPTAYAGAVLDKNGRPTAKKAPEGTTYAGITLPGSNAGLTMNGTPYTLIH
ncbi:MAG TPA: filamentous hemagglutinin N-terminal domain-containing protein, partial [Syntrophales bacterium]|nr:filamentous hemagglutinin N-terminal domain-containing protein [Syntrophales bacterium]